MNEKKAALRELTRVVLDVIRQCHALEVSGRLSRDQAQEQAIRSVRDTRYGPDKKDYFWINDMRPRMVMHPFRPDLEGEDITHFKDPEGRRLFVDMVETVRARGSGYVTYQWQWKDDPERIVTKLSYVEGFAPWGWVVGTGVYLEDVRIEKDALTRRVYLGGLLVTLLIAVFSGFLVAVQVRGERSRRRVEADLQATMARQRAILRAVPDPMVVYDMDGRATYINPAFTRVFGFEPGGVLGRQIDFVPMECKDETRESIFRLLEKEETYVPLVSRRFTRSGRLIDVSITAAVHRDEAGRPLGMVVNLRNISEQLRSEEALKASEGRFSQFFLHFPGVAFIKDREGRCLYSNEPRFQNRTGFDPAAGSAAADYSVPSEVAEEYSRNDQMVWASGRTRSFVERTFQEDGVHFWLAHKFLIERENEPYLLGGMSMDITDRLRAEDALRTSEQYHRSLFEDSPAPMALQDFSAVFQRVEHLRAQGVTDLIEHLTGHPEELKAVVSAIRFIQTNPAIRALYRMRGPDQNLVSVNQVVAPDEARHIIDQVAAFSRGDRFYQGEAKNRTVDGELLEVIVSKAIVPGHEKDWSRVLVTLTDVTALNRARRERKRLETRLVQAQKMEALGTLAGGIAHDFNNILGAMAGYSELALLKARDGEVVEKELRQVLKATSRARDLVRQILSFSRRTERSTAPIQLGPIVKETLKLLRATLPATIGIHFEIREETGTVLADPTQIHQVVMNLCTNAAHAMRDQGGRLSVVLDERSVGAEEDGRPRDLIPGWYQILEIRDTGHGIAPELLDRVFDPYFTTKDVGEGTGLGLSVVHGIVTAHGGRVQVASEPGQGTTFTVYLPLTPLTAEPEVRPAFEAPPGGTERVLLVDDESDLAQLGLQMLERLGYQVTVMTSSPEALRLFQEAPDRFDLLITDQTMPQMAGTHLAVSLLALRPNLPILLCTGFSETVDASTARDLGIRGFLTKPYSWRELARAVRDTLDGSDPED
jgi:PAS domain S-box-containing protein